MQINREIITIESDKLIDTIFQLPEVTAVKIRDVIMKREEERTDKLEEAMRKSYHDCCSDVDLAVLVTLSPQDIVTDAEYMKRIDRFGINEENSLGFYFVEGNDMYRIIMKNGMRYDFGFEFCYDENAEPVSFALKEEEYNHPNWFRDNVNRFWFMQLQALGKLYRKDFLIGSHLANMNLNETLVQQMVLRDMKYGTNHHRYGYEEDLTYLKYKGKCPVKSGNDTFDLIADKLYSAALAYDELTKAFYPEYESRSENFFEIWKCYEENREQEEGMKGTEVNMEATRKRLAEVAREKALLPFHGYIDGKESNIEPIVKHFPKWNLKEADRLWCAAFVYYCCVEAGFQIPYSPEECVTCSLAGCGGWEEYAIADTQIEYHRRGDGFVPESGDIVLYDRVFISEEHDHIGIVLEVHTDKIVVAEGNTFNDNISRVMERPIDEHIRAYIRIPDGYRYERRNSHDTVKGDYQR